MPLSKGKQRFHYDTDVKGLWVRVSGRTKSYIVDGYIGNQTKQLTIGSTDIFTPKQAKEIARQWLTKMRLGINPKEEMRLSETDQKRKKMTLEKSFDEFKNSNRLKQTTVKDYELYINRCFKKWKKRPLVEITRDMVLKKHKMLKENSGHHYADNALGVISSVISFISQKHADISGEPFIPYNPVKILKDTKSWKKHVARNTYIAKGELPCWFEAIKQLRFEQPVPSTSVMCDYLEFVLFTGLRKNEATTLRWDDIDFKSKTFTIEKTKNDLPHTLPITNYLLEILKIRKDQADAINSPWVFPSTKDPQKHLCEPRFIADKIEEICKVHFTIHDLRRTFATTANLIGISPYLIKRLLNHKKTDVTEGYMVVVCDDLVRPMNMITNHFLKFKQQIKSSKTA